ncbi:MAG: phosphate transport system permease protein [Thermotogaceae bacterium]|nr:phosphate transport system permease protein [Thermotogaceae bacterium]MDN5337559.1 phosphate transport system permease protein [Thermotogaceae bacterium]
MKKDLILKTIFRILTYSTFLATIGIFLVVIIDGARYFSIDFFIKYPSNAMTEGGVFPAIVGSLILISLGIIFSVPLGIIMGIFLSEYDTLFFIKPIDVALTSLSGIPSIVYGLFGLSLFCIRMNLGTSLISASLTLSLMTLPVIASSVKEAVKAVPVELREAAYALGCNKTEVISKVLLKAAKNRIITSALIGSGRIFGETAPIILTGAVFFSTHLPKSFLDPVMALPSHIYYASMAYGESAQWMAKASSALLLIIVLIIYSIAFTMRRGKIGLDNRGK